jgi:hypothetical protein
MARLSEQEQQEIIRFLEADKPLPDKYRFLLFADKREIIRVKNEENGQWEERWTGDYIFENEWQSFRTKKDRSLELASVFHECTPGRRKLAVKVVDIFGNDTMTIVDVTVGKKKG